MPSKAGTQSGKGLESLTAAYPQQRASNRQAPPEKARQRRHDPFWWNTCRYTHWQKRPCRNPLIGREALEAMGAQFFHIDRGGDITFHGPGQLVCYPIRPRMSGIGLRDYIGALEEAVIRTVAVYGITAGRMAGASGSGSAPESGETGAGTTACRGDNGGGNCNIGGNCGNKSVGGKSGDSGEKTATRQEPAIAAESAIAKSASGTGIRKGAAQDLRNRCPVVTLYHHARVRAERHDRPRVVHASTPAGY